MASLCEELNKIINASTCLKIMQGLVLFHNKPMYRNIYESTDIFWLDNTLLCSRDASYLEQPWSVVSHLLSRDEYEEEKFVFAAGMNWFEYSPVSRAIHVEEFLTDVIRLPQLTSAFLSDTVASHPLFKAWDRVKLERLVYEAQVYHSSTSKEQLIASGEVRYLKRKGCQTSGSIQYLYCKNGYTKARFVSMESPLEIKKNHLNQPRRYHGVSFLKEKVYVFGGLNDTNQRLKSIEVFDEKSQVWQIESSISSSRVDSATAIGTFYLSFYECLSKIIHMTACGEKILICGGANGYNDLNTTEWFDGSISPGPMMINTHMSPACAFVNGT